MNNQILGVKRSLIVGHRKTGELKGPHSNLRQDIVLYS